MGEPPYRFEAITYFSVADAEKSDLRIDHAKTLSLQIGSRIPFGRYSLVLIEPFPPFGRPGLHLARLKSFREEDIESIWVFPPSTDERSANGARVEITTTAAERAILRCKEIQVLHADVDQTR